MKKEWHVQRWSPGDQELYRSSGSLTQDESDEDGRLELCQGKSQMALPANLYTATVVFADSAPWLPLLQSPHPSFYCKAHAFPSGSHLLEPLD